MKRPTRLTETQASMVLAALPDLGPIRIRKLARAFGGECAAVLAAPPEAFRGLCAPELAGVIADWAAHFDLARAEAGLERLGARFVLPGEPGYPRRLAELPDAPIGLYVQGALGEGPAVALIGTRNPSAYGRKVTREFARGLAENGFTVVSGLARGIDTEAHEATLAVAGRTLAVLGGGLDVVYPPENRRLFAEIAERGCLMSEFYLGRQVDRQSFPQRNRIVAGLCELIVVVETDLKGGSMITCRFAGDYGRTVCAVPGRVDLETSRGCHALIRDGAVLVTSVEEILRELGHAAPQAQQGELTFNEGAIAGRHVGGKPEGAAESSVWTALADGSQMHPDRLCDRTGLSHPNVSAALLGLELKGLVSRRTDGTWERV